MAQPAIVAPNVRDLKELAAALVGWLGTRLVDAQGISVTNLPMNTGMQVSIKATARPVAACSSRPQ
mgnify:CR=1 FL=1